MKNIIISLFDYSGNWSKPYKESGFQVIQIDIKLGNDIMTWDYKSIDKSKVFGILAAPPCTDFAVSGAKFWKEKDKDGRTQRNIPLVEKTLEIIKYFNPDFWVIEQPIGRICKLLPEMSKYRVMSFNPCDFGDNYTKKTILYGCFNPLLIRNYKDPSQGSKMHRQYGGNSEKTKEARSITPLGFAYAFFNANNNLKKELIWSKNEN